MPLCFGTSGSVRTSSSHQFARWPSVFHVFCPLTTKCRRRAPPVICSDARSEPAFGLGEALAPDVVAAQHAGEQRALLLVGAVLDDRGRDVRQAERVQRARRLGAVHLLGEDDLLHDPGAAAAPLLGPGDRGVARVGERAVPRAQRARARSASISIEPPRPSPRELVGQVGRRARPGTPCGTPRPRAGSESPSVVVYFSMPPRASAASISRCLRDVLGVQLLGGADPRRRP